MPPLTFKLLPVRTARLVDSTGRMIPSVVALPVTAAEEAEAEHGMTRAEDMLLVAMLENRDASLADLARAACFTLAGGNPDKMKVRRLAFALRKDKLTTQVRQT